MKKNIVILVLIAVTLTGCSSLSPANGQREDYANGLQVEGNSIAAERVTVLPFTGGEDRDGDVLAQMLGTELSKIGNFQIVSRTAAIDKVMEEHKFQRTGLTDGDTIVELGKGANAKYVVSGHIQKLDDKKMISASIVDVETFQQIAGDYYEYNDLSDVVKYLPELAQKLATGTEKDYMGLPTLAILPFKSEDKNNSDVLAQLLAIELVNSGKYVVISRTTTIENVMKEHDIQRSELTESDTVSKLGIAVNADYVLSGSAYNLGNTSVMNVQIINVLTLVQENGAYGEYKTIEDGAKLMSKLSAELTGNVKIALPPLSTENIRQDLQLFKTLKWVGRGMWIVGSGCLLGAGTLALVYEILTIPIPDAYKDDMSSTKIMAIVGGAAIVAGGVLDIVFGIYEKKLMRKLEAQGVSINAAPIIESDFASGDVDYGMHVGVKYSF